MNINHLVTASADLTFAAIALITLGDFLRYRDRIRFQIAMVFGSLAIAVLVRYLQQLTGAPLLIPQIAATMVGLSHPYFLLRLVEQFDRVPNLVRHLARFGLLASWLVLLFTRMTLPGATPYLVLVYLLFTQSCAIVAMLRARRIYGGYTRRRLLMAALGALALMIGLLLSSVTETVPNLRTQLVFAVQSLTLLAALSYYFGFATPRWLRRIWGWAELHRFLQEAVGTSAAERAAQTVAHLCQAAIRGVGGLTAMTATWDPDTRRLTLRDSRTFSTLCQLPGDDEVIQAAWLDAKPGLMSVPNSWREYKCLPYRFTACHTFIIPIATAERVWSLLIVFLRQPPLFSQDDIKLLSLLAEQSAITLDYSAILSEQIAVVEVLNQRTEELNRANEQLKELDRLKSKFVSDVSHELRTPLNNVTLYLELLGKSSGEKQQRYLAILKEENRRLCRLVEEILDLSRLETLKEQSSGHFTVVDLNDVAEEVVRTHESHAEIPGLKLVFSPARQLPPIRGARGQLAKAVSNLVDNAIKYTSNGQVIISTSTDPLTRRVTLTVQDSGHGIPEDEIPHLFDRFYRGQAVAQSNIPGTGLGLSIVKEVVDLHSGQIEVTSRIGGGSTFTVHFPIAADQS